MLGFGGHFSTKSRRYSVTLTALRRARTDGREGRRRRRELLAGRSRDVVDTTLLVGHLAYADKGWHTGGDALLANTAAAQARQHARNNRDYAAALEKDIKAWIDTWNADPRPFTWVKTADEILSSLADYLAKIQAPSTDNDQHST